MARVIHIIIRFNDWKLYTCVQYYKRMNRIRNICGRIGFTTIDNEAI